MTIIFANALLLQVITVAVLRHRLGRTWLRRPVTLLVLASVVYNGLSPVLLAFPAIGKLDVYRQGVARSYVDTATLIMSAAMLAFTVCYLLTRPERPPAEPDADDIRTGARMLDERLLALACVPLAVLTYEGRGYNNALDAGAAASLPSNLASTFFVLLVVLTAFSFTLRRGGRWFLPVLAVQSLLLAAAGERTPVLVDAIALILLLTHAGMKPSRRNLRVAGGLTVVAILAITGVRAEQGRAIYYRDSGLGARVSALASGVTSVGGTSSQGSPGLLAQAAVRLDGTDFAGAIDQAESLGQPRLSAMAVPESLLLAVPSAVWPTKLAHGLNPVQAELDAFGLRNVNFLPGLSGLYFGFLPPLALILMLAAFGLAAGWGESWLLSRWTPARMVLLAGSITAALRYEQGAPGMLLVLRSAVAIMIAVKLAGLLLGRRAGRHGQVDVRSDKSDTPAGPMAGGIFPRMGISVRSPIGDVPRGRTL